MTSYVLVDIFFLLLFLWREGVGRFILLLWQPPWPNATLERKGCILAYRLQSITDGNQQKHGGSSQTAFLPTKKLTSQPKKEIQKELWRMLLANLFPSQLIILSQLSYIVQDHLPKDGTTHSRLSPPTSTNSHSNLNSSSAETPFSSNSGPCQLDS